MEGVVELEILVALEEGEQVIIAVVGKVRGTQVRQQLVWVSQLWQQLKESREDVRH